MNDPHAARRAAEKRAKILKMADPRWNDNPHQRAVALAILAKLDAKQPEPPKPRAATGTPGTCLWCGKPLINRTPRARYCDDACRHHAFDLRNQRG
jgi:hypothetical protein